MVQEYGDLGEVTSLSPVQEDHQSGSKKQYTWLPTASYEVVLKPLGHYQMLFDCCEKKCVLGRPRFEGTCS